MAVAFPSYLDALVEGFPADYMANTFPQREYIDDSRNVREYLEKLYGRLSNLLFHIDKKINKVLIQGRLLPKKLNQWAMEARAMKRQVSNLLEQQQNRKGDSLKCDKWIEIGIKMINLLKRCPFRDDMMYDKLTPIIIRNPELSSEKLSGRLEKYKGNEIHLSHVEDKMEHEQPAAEQTFSSSTDHGFQQEQDAGTSSEMSFPAVELMLKNVAAPPNEKFESGSISSAEIVVEESSDMPHAMISKISSADPNSSYISDDKSEQQFANEIIEEGEPGETAPERSDQQEEAIIDPACFQEQEHYSVYVEDNTLQLKLDNESHTILIRDYPLPAPLYSSPVEAMLELAAQDLRELKEESNYPDCFLLFLQRNNRLTFIHASFFDSMPNLLFLDLSDTKIRILPISLFKLSKLKVLLLRNCICLEKLPPEIQNLTNIEALDLSGSELYELPSETGQLTLIKSLQLSFYGPDAESEYEHLPSELVSSGFLSKLKELQALSIIVHPEDHRWTTIAADMVADISKLEMLSFLQFYFPEVKVFEEFIEMSPSWQKQKVCKFDFIVGQNVRRIVSRVPDEVESLFNLEDRCLRYVNGDTVSQWIKTMLTCVTALYLDHHTEVRSLSEFGITNFQALKFCIVRECPKIHAILEEKIGGSAFPRLEYLGIYFLWELKHIWKPPSQIGRLKNILKTPKASENFEALRYLIINTCPKLQFVLWESMLLCLNNLEELVVEDCERVKKIIKEENKKVKYKDNVLLGLKKLVLHSLPELVSVGFGVRLSKENITVNDCPKLIPDS